VKEQKSRKIKQTIRQKQLSKPKAQRRIPPHAESDSVDKEAGRLVFVIIL
jgi:hypothetical protein